MSPGGRSLAVPAGGFREIAILRLSSLGDVVLTLPVVDALARAYPGARLHYWVKEEFAEAVRHDSRIAHVRVLERDARRIEDLVSMSAELEACDLILDLHGNARTRLLCFRQKAPVLRVGRQRLLRARWVHARWTRPQPADSALLRYARTVAPIGLSVESTPRLAVPADAEAWADAWVREKLGPARPFVAICPAARHATKRWPEGYWVELLGALAALGHPVVAVSLARERETLPELARAIAATTAAAWCSEPLPRMGALLGRATSVVTGDTGLMHVAAARGARVVALFGSTSPALGFAPAGEGHAVLCRHEPCQPCTLHGRDACPKGHFRCMRDLRPEQVLPEVVARLDRA